MNKIFTLKYIIQILIGFIFVFLVFYNRFIVERLPKDLNLILDNGQLNHLLLYLIVCGIVINSGLLYHFYKVFYKKKDTYLSEFFQKISINILTYISKSYFYFLDETILRSAEMNYLVYLFAIRYLKFLDKLGQIMTDFIKYIMLKFNKYIKCSFDIEEFIITPSFICAFIFLCIRCLILIFFCLDIFYFFYLNYFYKALYLLAINLIIYFIHSLIIRQSYCFNRRLSYFCDSF